MARTTERCGLPTAALLLSLSAAVAGSCVPPAPTPQPPQQAQLARAVSPPARLMPPEQLSGTARSILRSRMGFHARDMAELVSAIMILDYPGIQERALAISADVSLARPLTGDATELASALPESFFLLQDETKAHAAALASAAAKQSAFTVADAYGNLSETCVKCHASYRQGK